MYESMVFYKSFYDAIKGLAPEMQAEVYNAVFEYGLYGQTLELSPIANTIFTLIKPQIDANNKRRENGKKGAEYGKLGGRPKKDNGTKTDKKPLKNPEQTPNVNDNVNVNDNDNDNVNDTDNDNENEKVNDIKPKKRQKKSAVTREVYYPNDELLDKAFRDYVNMRIEIKKPFVTDEAIDKAMDKLKNLSGGNNDTAIQICNESVMNSWQGLFPVRSGDSGRFQPQTLAEKWGVKIDQG